MYASTNPANLADEVARFELASADDLLYAANRAHGAQRDWAAVPAPARGRVLAQVGRLIEANKEALAQLVTREIGKVYAEALGEVQEVIDTCDFFLGEGRRLYGQTVPSEMPDKQLFTFRMPVGTACIITASNFPAAVPSWYIVPALLCGNTVVWKPAETAGAVAQAMTALFHAGGVPKDVLQCVIADGATTAAALPQMLEHKYVQKVGFTGSTAIGRQIGELCGRYLQSPCLELGGKNPMIVMPDADIDLVVEGALFAGFGTAGQRCTSLGTLWVHRSIYDTVKTRWIKAVEEARVGDPMQDGRCGPMISQTYLDNHLKHLEWRPGDKLYANETFGPLVGLGVFDTLEEAIELGNGHGFGLSCAIYTNDPKSAWRFRQGISAGMVSVNNSTSGAEAHLPFGGNGNSGNGSRQSGIWVLDQFTRWQSMNWDYSGKLQKAQMDIMELPYDPEFRLS